MSENQNQAEETKTEDQLPVTPETVGSELPPEEPQPYSLEPETASTMEEAGSGLTEELKSQFFDAQDDNSTPTMAASPRLKPFSPKKLESKPIIDSAAGTDSPPSGLTGTLAPPAASTNLGDLAPPGMPSSIHSGTEQVAGLDLMAPGQAVPTGNHLIRGLSRFWNGLIKFWKIIPPPEDIFDKIMTSLGFQRKPASMLRRAQSLSAKGRYAESIKWFRDILYLRPLTIAAYDGLGRVYFRMGLVEEANREFIIADCLERLVNNRDDLDAACSLAKALMERKQSKMAASLLEPVLIAHFYAPNNSDLLKRMGLIYADLRASKKMFQVYEAGLAQHPDDHEFFILKGNLDIKLGRISEGEKLIRWGRLMGRLKENPTDVNANMAMGELCLKENKTDEGLGYLKEAAVLSPENSGIRWRLFNLYQKQGAFPEALRYFLEVIAIEPENEELKYRLADFYRKNHHFDEAQDIYRALMENHPRDPKPHNMLSNLLTEMGQFDEAQKFKTLAETLAIGLKEEPDHVEIVVFMKYLFSINENAEALEWLEKGLTRWPYHGELIMTKVKILYNEYQYKDAVKLLKRLNSVKNNLAEPHMWIAMCYQRLGDHMAALAEAQLSTRLAPKSFTAHKVLGDILKEQKKLSQANAAYEVAEMIKLSQTKASTSR